MTKTQQKLVGEADRARVASYNAARFAYDNYGAEDTRGCRRLAQYWMKVADRLESRLPQAWGPAGASELNGRKP